MRQIGLPTVIALAVALVAISSSAPMIAFAAAPGLAIAFWRNTLAVTALAPVAVNGARRRELLDLLRPDGRRPLLVCVLAGLFLAVHFGTWIPSAQLTSVAMAAALVSTTPVWTAVIAAVRGIHVPWTTWLGIGIAVLGVALATGADLNVSDRALFGDALALAGGAAAAVYTTYGQHARESVSTTAYTTVCYSICAVVLGLTCLAAGVPVLGFPTSTWVAIVAMTVGPQLLGHSLINYSLHRLSATTVAVLLLLEVPGAVLIAWAFLDQLPDARSVPGLVILMVGVTVVVAGTGWRRTGQDQPTNGGTEISPEAIGTT